MSNVEHPEVRVRLKTDIEIINPAQIVNKNIPSKRIYQADSVDPDFVKTEMFPSCVAVYGKKGEIFPIENNGAEQYILKDGKKMLANHAENNEAKFDREKLKEFEGIINIPVSTWGKDSIMYLHADPDASTFMELPRDVLKMHLRQQAGIIDELQKDGRPAYWGNNCSPSNIEGKGLQSVLLYHSQVFRFGHEMDLLNPTVIKQIRNEQVWDEGISAKVGAFVADRMKEDVLPKYWDKFKVEEDPMGLTIELPGFKPSDFADISFADKLWKPLSLLARQGISKVHSLIYNSDFKDMEAFFREERRKGKIDLDKFSTFFEEKNGPDCSSINDKLHDYYSTDDLKKPAGWTGTIQFRKDEGAFIAVSFGFCKASLGPVESLGVSLKRPKDALPDDEMKEKLETVYKPIIEKVVWEKSPVGSN